MGRGGAGGGAEDQQFCGEVWEESQPCAGAFDLAGVDESSRERTEHSEKPAARGHPDALDGLLSFLDFSFYPNSEIQPGQRL